MRKLNLEKETLVELSGEELDLVAGGSGLSCNVCVSGIVTCATYRCLPTWNACFTTEGCG
ncbi:MAG TPA: class I lanthipeptide [Frankiaceae bacterium]|nr:class I lanthipeptide [Frankiaceae bacterium]